MHTRSADALHGGLADCHLPVEQFAELDRCLDEMGWNVHPAEALRTLLATLTSNRLPASELAALQPAIDRHFSLPDVATIRASLRAERRPEYRD